MGYKGGVWVVDGGGGWRDVELLSDNCLQEGGVCVSVFGEGESDA